MIVVMLAPPVVSIESTLLLYDIYFLSLLKDVGIMIAVIESNKSENKTEKNKDEIYINRHVSYQFTNYEIFSSLQNI